MNYTLDDRHRSIRRFLMNALGSPPWTIRTERQPVTNEQRPVAVVEPASASVTVRSRTSIPQGDVEKQQTFALTLYPEREATAAESRLTAQEWAEALEQAITVGMRHEVEVPDPEDPEETVMVEVDLSAPEMVPVYDYDDVAVKGKLRQGPAEPYGWLRVESYGVRPIQDPEDHLRWTIVCDLRVSWTQGGRVRPDGPIASEAGWQHEWVGVGAADAEEE